VDWKCIIGQTEQLPAKRPRENAEDSPTRTPEKSPTEPAINSSGKGLDKRDLEADNTEEKHITPIPFPSLNANLEELAKFNELMSTNEAYRSAILNITKKHDSGKASRSKQIEEEGEEVEDPSPHSSPSRLKTSKKHQEAEGLKEITHNLIPMMQKAKMNIRLDKLEERPITAWGDATELYERQNKTHWERSEIDRMIRHKIGSRWTMKCYRSILPQAVQDDLNLLTETSWMDPKIISTVELARFLKKTCTVTKGTSNLNAGSDELLELINKYNLPMRRGSIAEGIEDFLLKVQDHNDSVGSEYNERENKDLSRAIHDMVKRGRRDGPYDLSLDVAVGRAIVEQLKNDKKTSLATTLTLLKDGLYWVNRGSMGWT
jgi:hypothetical protein